MSEQLVIQIRGEAANFTRTMRQVDHAIQKAQGSVRSFSRHSVSGTQAASAAIRLLEGDMTNMVRAAENFIGRSRALSGVLQTAFPVIGAVALISVIGEGIEKTVKFIETARKVPHVLQEGFRGVTLSQQLAVDSLQLTNAKLANQISLLEHKPADNVATALAEARKQADELAISLEKDNQKLTELMTKGYSGFSGGIKAFLTGHDTSGDIQTTAGGYLQKMEDLGYQRDIALHGGNTTQAAQLSAQLASTQSQYSSYLTSQIKMRTGMVQTPDSLPGHPDYVPYAMVHGNQDANLTILRGLLATQDLNQDQTKAQATNSQLQQKKQQLDAAKQAAAQAKAAQEKLLQTWQSGLDRAKALYNYSTSDQANYWLTMASHAKVGSAAYVKALDNANRLIAQQQKELGTNLDKWRAAQLSPNQSFRDSSGQTQSGSHSWSSDLSRNPDAMRSLQKNGQATATWLTNLREGTDIERANAQALREQSLQMAIASGHISRMDAAQMQATLHTEEYTSALADLRRKRQAIADATWMSAPEQRAQLSGLDMEISTLQGQRAQQMAQDQAAIQSATAMGTLRDAARQLAQQFGDLGGNLAMMMTGAIQGTNASLGSALTAKYYTGQQRRWGIENALGGQMRSIGGQGMSMGLGMIESPLLSKFGLGGLGKKHKPAGNASDPIYVRSADTQTFSGVPGVNSVMSGNADPLNLIAPSVDTSGLSSLLPLFPAIPGFASGGTTPSNMPFLVGEHGPEIMSMPYPTHVTPNNRIGSLGGSTTHINIDARGATDPAAVRAMVMQGISQAAPHIVAASQVRRQDHIRRVPPSARK